MGKKKFQTFIGHTWTFTIIGFFIPGFTAVGLLGLQIATTALGIECSGSWLIVSILTLIGMIIAPIVFVRKMKMVMAEGRHLGKQAIMIFNLLEYTFIQGTLVMFFSNRNALCYGRGGQNGLELVFYGWLALPFLLIFSKIFDSIRKTTYEELNAGNLE